jgi:hypothetical protein
VGADNGVVILIAARLFFSALATVFAIVIWSKTRDSAWVLMILGVVSGYAENIYFVLAMLGITESLPLAIDTVPVVAILLSCLPSIFFIAAFRVFLSKRKIKPLI